MAQNFHPSRHPLVAHKLSQMRRDDLPYGEFRRLMREIGMMMAYEVTEDLSPKDITINTPRGAASGYEFQNDKPVIVPILRSGLIMAEGIQEVISRSIIGHIGIHRNKSNIESTQYFVSLPSPTENGIFIIIDPVIATGITMSSAIETLKDSGVSEHNIRAVSILSSEYGKAYLEKWYADVNFYCAHVDSGSTEESKKNGGLNDLYQVVPGIGSVSQRLFGFSAT